MYTLNPEYIYLNILRGDQEISPAKNPYAKIFNGMTYHFLDQQMWPEQVVLSDYSEGEMCTFEIPRALFGDCQNAVKDYPVNGVTDN